MEGHALEIGRLYAFRAKRGAGEPMLKVKLIDKVGRKGMVKVRFENGEHPGLEEYVSTRQIVVPWGDRKPLLRDEKRETELAEHARHTSDPVLGEAASAVLESSGEPGGGAVAWGTMMDEDELQRIMDRAGVEGEPADLHPIAFRDRRFQVHLPLEVTVGLAKAFAAAEPETVVQYLDDREQEYRVRGNTPGERWWHDYLREKSPSYALARRWAGLEQEAELLRKEIARLRILVSRAASDLSAAGAEPKARRLLRALEGR